MDSETEKSMTGYLEKLRTRRPDTKYRLLELLVAMGDCWHSVEEIKQSASKKQIGTHHLFENLIELYRTSGLLERDAKEKRSPNLSRFKIKTPVFPPLKQALEGNAGS